MKVKKTELKNQVLTALNLKTAKQVASWAKKNNLSVDLCYTAHWQLVLNKINELNMSTLHYTPESHSRHRNLEKRGGSSGGGGGAASTQNSTQESKSSFRRVGEKEVESLSKSWESEFNEMNASIKDTKDGRAINKYTGIPEEQIMRYMVTGESFQRELFGNRLGVVDKKGNLQAGLVYNLNKNYIEIDSLSTAPWNITKDSRATKGAGTRAVVEAIKLHKEKGGTGEVRLTSSQSAIPYFKKLGFKQDGDKSNKLKLSKEDADSLLGKFGEAS
jgi:hypothetical protein